MKIVKNLILFNSLIFANLTLALTESEKELLNQANMDMMNGNYSQAATKFEKLCNTSEGVFSLSCSMAGSIYDEALKDYAKAKKYYEIACKEKDIFGAQACNNLGSLYHNGKIKGGNKQAEKFYKKACDGGDDLACKNLGAKN